MKKVLTHVQLYNTLSGYHTIAESIQAESVSNEEELAHPMEECYLPQLKSSLAENAKYGCYRGIESIYQKQQELSMLYMRRIE